MDKGTTTASDQLIGLARERGDMDQLRRLADKGPTTDQLFGTQRCMSACPMLDGQATASCR